MFRAEAVILLAVLALATVAPPTSRFGASHGCITVNRG